uniref:Photosystem II protein J n=1 Tax=Cucurbita maxima TaxID=3661 RepID=A0A2H4T1V7_CUCMA|nr:photosystem II protein J [Cucurbita maxima]ATY69862.1 photosystem II protein J [Cucurbita maxima]
MAETTGRIPLWIIGTVTGIPVIGLFSRYFLLWFIFWIRFISVIIG